MRLGERMKCTMFLDNCRFCSHEHHYIPYTPLVENKKTMRLEIGATNIRKELIGEFCNNIGGWVQDLKYCPARWGLYGIATTGYLSDGCGVYSDAVGQSGISEKI